jgi:hypothetical protein
VNTGFALGETARMALPNTTQVFSAPAAVFTCSTDGCTGQAHPRGNESQVELRQCSIGFSGALCAVCDEDAGFVKDGGTCTQCDTGSSIAILAPVLGGVLFVGFIYKLASKWRQNRANTASMSVGVVSFLGGLMIQLKILIGLMQITTQLPVTLSIRYPDLFSEFLKAIGIVLLDIFDVFKVDCLSPLSLHAKFIVIMVLPLVGIAFVQFLRCASNHGATKEQEATNRSSAAYRSFFVIFLCVATGSFCCKVELKILLRRRLYPLLSRTTFSIFRCQTLAVGERWHEDDFSIDCDSSTHTAIVIVDIFCILVYPVGIPVIFMGLLWRDEQSRKSNEAAKPGKVAEDTKSSYSFLRQDYKET